MKLQWQVIRLLLKGRTLNLRGGNLQWQVNSTYSNLRRKIKIKARMEARRFVRERPSLSKLQLQILFKGRKDHLLESFGKIREFEKRDLTPSDWTFWTYAARISKIIDPKISRIPHQLRSLKKTIFDEANDALLRAMK